MPTDTIIIVEEQYTLEIGAPGPQGPGGEGGTAYETVGVTIDGGSAVIPLGSHGFRPIAYAGVIESWTIMADQEGDLNLDVRKTSFSAFPDDFESFLSPAMASAQKATGEVNVPFNANDVLEFFVSNVAAIRRVTLFLRVRRV